MTAANAATTTDTDTNTAADGAWSLGYHTHMRERAELAQGTDRTQTQTGGQLGDQTDAS